MREAVYQVDLTTLFPLISFVSALIFFILFFSAFFILFMQYCIT